MYSRGTLKPAVKPQAKYLARNLLRGFSALRGVLNCQCAGGAGRRTLPGDGFERFRKLPVKGHCHANIKTTTDECQAGLLAGLSGNLYAQAALYTFAGLVTEDG